MDPRRYRSGRWLLLAEGVMVSAFGIAGLISAALQPHEGPTGAPVLGFATTAPHSAILLAFGLVAIAAVGNRRAAITVTALSAIAYFMLLFFSSVATARANPTPLGFHAAHIVLHAVLGVVNLALLMWLIPDELGDEAWGPRPGRSRDRRQPSAVEAVTGPAAGSLRPASTTNPEPPPAAPAATAQEPATHESPPRHQVAVEQPRQNEPSTRNVPDATRPKRPATRAADAARSRGFVPVAVAVAAAVVIVIWMRRRR